MTDEPDYTAIREQLGNNPLSHVLQTGLVPFDLQAPARLLFPMTGPYDCRVCGEPVEGYAPLRDRAAIEKHAPCREQEETWRAMVRATFADDDVVQARMIAQAYIEAADKVFDTKIKALDVPEWVKESELAIAEEDDSE